MDILMQVMKESVSLLFQSVRFLPCWNIAVGPIHSVRLFFPFQLGLVMFELGSLSVLAAQEEMMWKSFGEMGSLPPLWFLNPANLQPKHFQRAALFPYIWGVFGGCLTQKLV